jgi:hypothetical protein
MISPSLRLEKEYVIMYPKVAERLREAGLTLENVYAGM